jgi:hypothetical protein
MQSELREFVADCEAAGMTPSAEWELPADRGALMDIYKKHEMLIVNTSMPEKVSPKLRLKPYIWLVYTTIRQQLNL